MIVLKGLAIRLKVLDIVLDMEVVVVRVEVLLEFESIGLATWAEVGISTNQTKLVVIGLAVSSDVDHSGLHLDVHHKPVHSHNIRRIGV